MKLPQKTGSRAEAEVNEELDLLISKMVHGAAGPEDEERFDALALERIRMMQPTSLSVCVSLHNRYFLQPQQDENFLNLVKGWVWRTVRGRPASCEVAVAPARRFQSVRAAHV